MFHDIRTLLLMIFLATRACKVLMYLYMRHDACVHSVCELDEWARNSYPFLHKLVKSRARINYHYKVARRQNDKWRCNKRNAQWRSDRWENWKQLKLPPVFSASLANVKKKEKKSTKRNAVDIFCVSLRISSSHAHKRFVRAESSTQ